MQSFRVRCRLLPAVTLSRLSLYLRATRNISDRINFETLVMDELSFTTGSRDRRIEPSNLLRAFLAHARRGTSSANPHRGSYLLLLPVIYLAKNFHEGADRLDLEICAPKHRQRFIHINVTHRSQQPLLLLKLPKRKA